MNYKWGNVYNEDCMIALRQMPDNFADLCIVDPPYGIGVIPNGRTRNGGTCAKPREYKNNNWDKKSPNKEYFKELIRVSKNQIIWGANHFISKIPFDSSCWIVWDKEKTGYFADCELAWTSFKTAVKKFRYRWNGMLQENMKNKENIIHPTQKPVALYKWLLTNYAKQGDKILDTHVGSGSSIIACYDLGFEYMGFELDEDYYKAMMHRINEHKAQISFL